MLSDTNLSQCHLIWHCTYIYFAQGKPEQTIERSQQALTVFHAIEVPRLEAFAHRALSLGYGELGNGAKAMVSAEAFLAFARKVQNPVFEKDALTLLGDLHHRFRCNDQAIATYQAALTIPADQQVAGADAGIYAGLAPSIAIVNKPPLALFNTRDLLLNKRS